MCVCVCACTCVSVAKPPETNQNSNPNHGIFGGAIKHTTTHCSTHCNTLQHAAKRGGAANQEGGRGEKSGGEEEEGGEWDTGAFRELMCQNSELFGTLMQENARLSSRVKCLEEEREGERIRGNERERASGRERERLEMQVERWVMCVYVCVRESYIAHSAL